MNEINEVMKIADIHVSRINSAIRNTKHLFPMNKESLESLHENDMVWVDLLINRFGKLQYLIGSKIIDMFFILQEEKTDTFTMLDKLHKLEKLEIIDDIEVWKEMRKVRNHIAHEYPDQPAIMSQYLNRIFYLTPTLIGILENFKNRIG